MSVVVDVLLRPKRFFSEQIAHQPFSRALGLAVLVEAINFAASLGWSAQEEGARVVPRLFIGLVAGALFGVPWLYFYAGLLHASARWLGGKNEFAVTLRLAAFSGVPLLLGVIPFGAVLGAFWRLALVGIAMRCVHGLSIARAVGATIAPFFFMAMLAGGIRAWVFEPFLATESAGMYPTLAAGDHVAGLKLGYGMSRSPERGDLVIFAAEKATDRQGEIPKRAARIVGLSGDRVLLTASGPTINGWQVPRCRVGHVSGGEENARTQAPKAAGTLYVEFLGGRAYLVFVPDAQPVTPTKLRTVPEGKAWLLGDDRTRANEPSGGIVALERVLARAWFVWLPVDRFGLPLSDDPSLPESSDPELANQLEQCLKSRPAPENTVPPRP